MSKRFGNIARGAEEATALQNYLKYISDPSARQTKRQKGGTRDTARERTEEKATITPFGNSGQNLIYIVEMSKTALDAFSGFNTALVETKRLNPITAQAPVAAGAVQLPTGYRPPRAHVFVPDGTAEYVQSKITKEYYLKYGGKSHSLPFGALAGGESTLGGETAVKAALLNAGGNKQYFRVSITPEKVSIPF